MSELEDFKDETLIPALKEFVCEKCGKPNKQDGQFVELKPVWVCTENKCAGYKLKHWHVRRWCKACSCSDAFAKAIANSIAKAYVGDSRSGFAKMVFNIDGLSTLGVLDDKPCSFPLDLVL